LELYLDGGIRRGTDIFKALALGARAVGMSRPALWGAAAYGEEGVGKVLDMLCQELHTTMRLMGTTSLADIHPSALSLKQTAESRL
jgi:L-lactate dehydrogenase (cytochrome)